MAESTVLLDRYAWTPGTRHSAMGFRCDARKWGENGQYSVKPRQRPPDKTVGKPPNSTARTSWRGNASGGTATDWVPRGRLNAWHECTPRWRKLPAHGGSMYSRATASSLPARRERCHVPTPRLKRTGGVTPSWWEHVGFCLASASLSAVFFVNPVESGVS